MPINLSNISKNTVHQWRKRTTAVAAAAFTRGFSMNIQLWRQIFLPTQPTRSILVNGNFSAMLASLKRTEIHYLLTRHDRTEA